MAAPATEKALAVEVDGQTFFLDDDELSRELFLSKHYPRREFRADEHRNLWFGPHCRVDLVLAIARQPRPEVSPEEFEAVLSRLKRAFSSLGFYDPLVETRHLDGDPRDLRAANLAAPPAPVFPPLGPRFPSNFKNIPADVRARYTKISGWLSSNLYNSKWRW